MNVNEILSKSYRLTNKDVTTFLDGVEANVLEDLNECHRHRWMKILKVRQDLNPLITEQKTNLVATDSLNEGDIGYNGEYPFSADTLNPVRIEVSYDGLTWNKAKFYDLNDNPNSEFGIDDVNSSFTTSSPAVRFERDSYFVRPILTGTDSVTAGIHLWWEQRQPDLSTDDPEFEKSFHDLLAYDLAKLEVLMHPDKYDVTWQNSFNQQYGELETLFDEFYKNRMKRNFTLRTNFESYK